MASRGSILIVEADADAREMLRVALEADGYDVATADSAQDALHHMRSNDTACVIVDLDPPAEAARFVAAQRHDRALAWIPIVVVSERPDALDAARQLGVRAWFTKPFDLDALRRAVAEVGAAARDRR